MITLTKDRSGNDIVELTPEQVKKIVRTGMGETYDGALVISTFWRREPKFVDWTYDYVLEKGYFWIVLCVENKMFKMGINPIINEDGSDWSLSDDYYEAIPMEEIEIDDGLTVFKKIEPISGITFPSVREF